MNSLDVKIIRCRIRIIRIVIVVRMMKFLVLTQFVSKVERLKLDFRTNFRLRIGEFLVAFQTRDEIFVIGVFFDHMLFKIGFSCENCWTVCTMKLLRIRLMGQHMSFQTIALSKTKFTNLKKKKNIQRNLKKNKTLLLCIGKVVHLKNKKNLVRILVQNVWFYQYEHVNDVLI